MVCKFHAAMNTLHPSLLLGAAVALALLAVSPATHAEKADRSKKMEIEADQPGKVDIRNKVITFNGNVVVTQGTMKIRADSIQVKEDADGFQSGTATGGPGGLARFTQKRDNLNEWVEGEARTIQFNGKDSRLTLTGQASTRRLNGTEVADQVTGAEIVYDNALESYTVSGGAKAATPDNPTGRVKVELAPRKGTRAAAEAAAQPAEKAGSAP